MRIGEFIKKNNVSMDTVRYYMDLGILVPRKKGGHYDFDDNCSKDLEQILELKALGFTLNEIKTFFYYKKFMIMENDVSPQYYKTFYEKKMKDTQKTIEKLEENLITLENKLHQLTLDQEIHPTKTGIELGALSILRCPICSGKLTLEKGSIEGNQIIEGELLCCCNKKYAIREGILFIEKQQTDEETHFNYDLRGEMLYEYVESTDIHFLDNLYKGLNWYNKSLESICFNGKTLLELGIGSGMFLRLLYNRLAEDSIYIAIDHDIQALQFIKDILETAGGRKNVLFICTDFKKLPLKLSSIDILVDFSGSVNYNVYNADSLLRSMTAYLKDKALLLGGYILFHKFGLNNKLEQKYRQNYRMEKVKGEIKDLNFEVLDEMISEKIHCDRVSKYEALQQIGDIIFIYSCICKYSKGHEDH